MPIRAWYFIGCMILERLTKLFGGLGRLSAAPPRIGLECSPHVLKVAWSVSGSGGRTTWGYRQQLCRQDQTPDSLSEDLATLLAPLRAHQFNVHLVLAAPNSTVRRLTLDVPSAAHLREAINERLPKLLPFDVERAEVTFRVRRQQPSDGQLECSVVLAACDRAALQQYLDALWSIGWTPGGVAPASLALVRTAKALGVLGQEAVVLMDLGTHQTTIALVEEGETVYARDVALGTTHLVRTLTDQLSLGQETLVLSHAEAETLLQTVGIPEVASAQGTASTEDRSSEAGISVQAGRWQLPMTTYRSMIQPVLEQLIGELRRTMTFGVQTATAAVPQRVWVSGEGSRLPQCERWLERQLSVPVSRLDCERWVGQEGSTAALACGLALFDRAPELDLLPNVSRQRGTFIRIVAWAWQGLAALVLLTWAGAGWWMLQHLTAARELKQLESRWEEVRPLIALRDAVSARTELIHRLVRTQGVPADWFNRLATGFPKSIRLTRLAVNEQHQVTMSGQAQEREQTPEAYVSELVLWLQQSRLCQNVQLGSSHRSATTEGLVEFSLTCQM